MPAVLRWVSTVFLLYAVFRETGWATTLALFLCAVTIELLAGRK